MAQLAPHHLCFASIAQLAEQVSLKDKVSGLFPTHLCPALIAQLVEQIPLKDKVAGSNPAEGTNEWVMKFLMEP